METGYNYWQYYLMGGIGGLIVHYSTEFHGLWLWCEYGL